METHSVPQKGKSWVKRHPILTVIGIILFIIIISSFGKTTKQSGTDIAQNIETKKALEVIKVTAIDLGKEYIANEVSADTKYKGKNVEVSGTIKDIGKDIIDTPYIIINTNPSDYFTQVQCMFSKNDIDIVGSLQKNTAVVVQGEVSGKLGNILIRECKIK